MERQMIDNGLRLKRLLKDGFKGWRMLKTQREFVMSELQISQEQLLESNANLLLRLKQKLGAK
jgi:hypothetical protein|tara:strand:- start:383 stop:571 length:189 start_codon:yes stop_codon:yes gene_type:complete